MVAMAALLLLLLLWAEAVAAPTELFVGRRPFASVRAAIDAYKALPLAERCAPGGVVLTIAGGTYPEGLHLGQEDSGCHAAAPLILRADPSDRMQVVFHGGVEIPLGTFRRSVWRASASETVWQADLRSVPGGTELAASSGDFQQGWVCANANGSRTEFFFGGAAMTLARHPNKEEGSEAWQYMRQGAVLSTRSFAAGTDDTAKGRAVAPDPPWAGANESEGLWAQGFFSWDWADSFVKVAQVSRSTQQRPPIVDIERPPAYPLKSGSRYILLNSKALLDAPGEYFIDRNSSTLYFIPPRGMDPSKPPSGRHLGSFLSSKRHAHTLSNLSHVVLQGLQFQYSRGAALVLSGVSGVTIDNCTMANAGTAGVVITGGSSNTTIRNSNIFGVGCDGLIMRGGDPVTLRPGHLLIKGNRIHHYARISRTIRPGISWSGCGNVVSGNEIFSAPHSGIMIDPVSDGRGVITLFEGNYLHDLCQGTADAGGFYAGDSWANRGNVVRGNRFRNLFPTERMAQTTSVNGVYLDTLESGWLVEDNIFESIGSCVFLAGGRQNKILNNTFRNCSLFPVYLDSAGLMMNCKTGNQNGCAGFFIQELERIYHFRQPPWSLAFPSIRVDLLDGKNHSPPVLNIVEGNHFCFPRPPPPTPPPVPGCAMCPPSHRFPFEPTPGWGSFCCTKQPINKACVGGSICCLLPGTHRKTRFGSHGCQGINRCGSNLRNQTPCAPPPPAPIFTNFFAGTKALPAWQNKFANNKQYECSLKTDDSKAGAAATNFSIGSPTFNLTFDAASLALLSITTTSMSSGRTQSFLLPSTKRGQQHSLWQLNFTDCRCVMPHGWAGHAWQLDSNSYAVNRSYTITPTSHGGTQASLHWLGVSSPPSLHLLDVKVTIVVPTQGSSQLILRGGVHKRGQPGICIQNMALPNLERMILRSPQLDSLFVPWYFGQVGDLSHLCGSGLCTLDLWRSHMQNVDYPYGPNGQRSMQFMALYSRDEHEEENGAPEPPSALGLYIGAHNSKSYLNMLLMDGKYCRPDDDPHSAVRWLHMPDDLLDSNPGADYDIPYDIVMAGFEGDWFDASLIYRAWATTETVWTQDGNLSAKMKSANYPRWLLETPLWTLSYGYASNPATDHGSHTHAADIKLRQLLGVPTATHWYGWEEEPYDTLYPQFSPFDNSSCGRFNKSDICGNFSNTSRMLKAAGVSVIPYTNGRLFDPRLPAWTEEAANDSACRQFSGVGRVGTPYWEKYEQHRNWSFAVMNPASVYWREKVSSFIRAIQRAGNTSGMYLDQLASYYPQVCFSDYGRHGAAGSTWADGVRQILDSADAAVGSGKAIISESNNEAYIGSLHANLALYGWRECATVPAYQAVYGGFIVNVGATGWPEPAEAHVPEYRALFAQQFIFGHVLGWTYAGNILDAFSHEGDMAFLRSLVQLKLSHAQYLVYGRLMRPPRVSGLHPLPQTTLCNGNGKNQVCCNYSAVVGQVWMAADSTLGLVLVNSVNDTSAVEIKVSIDTLALGNLVTAAHYTGDGIQHNESHALRVGIRKHGLVMKITMQPLSARVVRISNALKTDDSTRHAHCIRNNRATGKR